MVAVSKAEAILNRDIWKMMSKIKDIILDNDGMIFGGFVRDSILHDHFAQEFYRLAEEAEEEDHGNVCFGDYCEPCVLPETWERTTVPSDIDFYIPEQKLEEFKKSLVENRFRINSKFVRDPRTYFQNFDNKKDNTMRHHRLYISPDLKSVKEELANLFIDVSAIKQMLGNMRLPFIKLDIITSSKNITEPFFSPVDFECNALYLTKHGISMAESLSGFDIVEKTRKIINICDDITKKQTKLVNAQGFRTRKLVEKGWTIYDNNITTIMDDSYEGYCIICHDSVEELHIKSQCCDCRFHPNCLAKSIIYGNMKNCVMCKQNCNLSSKHLDMLHDFPESI